MNENGIVVDSERKTTGELLKLCIDLLKIPEKKRDYVGFVKRAENLEFKPIMRSEGWNPPLPEDSSQHFTAVALIDYVDGFIVEYNNSHGGVVIEGKSPIDYGLFLKFREEHQKEKSK